MTRRKSGAARNDMEEARRQDHHSNSGHAFLLGVVVGVAVTLLFTTKRGRKILKALTDEGMDKIGRWEKVLYRTQSETEDDGATGSDYVPPEGKIVPPEDEPNSVAHPDDEKQPGGRRFFKGAKKS